MHSCVLWYSHFLHDEFVSTSNRIHHMTSPHDSTQPPLPPQQIIAHHIPSLHTTQHHTPAHHTPFPHTTPHHGTAHHCPSHSQHPKALPLPCYATHRLLTANIESDAQVSCARRAHPHSGRGSVGPNTRTCTAGTCVYTSTHTDHVSFSVYRHTHVIFLPAPFTIGSMARVWRIPV